MEQPWERQFFYKMLEGKRKPTLTCLYSLRILQLPCQHKIPGKPGKLPVYRENIIVSRTTTWVGFAVSEK